MQNNSVFGLDFLRAIAITLVVVSHCTYILIEETNNPIFISLHSLGAIGVDLLYRFFEKPILNYRDKKYLNSKIYN